jgi:hypothetical protein
MKYKKSPPKITDDGLFRHARSAFGKKVIKKKTSFNNGFVVKRKFVGNLSSIKKLFKNKGDVITAILISRYVSKNPVITKEDVYCRIVKDLKGKKFEFDNNCFREVSLNKVLIVFSLMEKNNLIKKE